MHNHNHGYSKTYRHESQQKKDAAKAAEEAKMMAEEVKEAEQAKATTEEAQAQPAAEGKTEAAKATEQAEVNTTEEKAAEMPQDDSKDKKIEELQNQLARMQADFSNVRKRSAQDQERLAAFVTASVAREFLKVLDNFDRAEESMEQQGNTAEAMHEGMTKIHKQFQQALQALKIEEIPAQGQKFNPEFHEAVMQNTNSDLPDETIDLVAEKGYKIGDNIIRHSKVRVVKK